MKADRQTEADMIKLIHNFGNSPDRNENRKAQKTPLRLPLLCHNHIDLDIQIQGRRLVILAEVSNDFPQPLYEIGKQYLKLYHDHLLPDTYQLSSIQSVT